MDIEKLYGELEKRGVMMPCERKKAARKPKKSGKILGYALALSIVAVSLLFLCIWSICQKG